VGPDQSIVTASGGASSNQQTHAELIAALSASGEAGRGHAEVPEDCEGSIDSIRVRELVEEILEGGREAFEMRRLKYGF
jgi:hypothetical protein